MFRRSKKSDATHVHRDGALKVSPAKISGVNIVSQGRAGDSKIAVTPEGAKRLRKELRFTDTRRFPKWPR